MKKVLFVGHFSEQTKQMQKELAQFVKIQLCSDNVTIAESMMSIYEPDLVLVNVEGFTDSHLEFFQVLAEKYARVPVILIGSQDAYHRYAMYDMEEQISCVDPQNMTEQALLEAMMARIDIDAEILPDGTIPQVEITTQGLDYKPIPAYGSIPAAYACNLTSGKPVKLGVGKQQKLTRVDESEGEIYVADILDNTQLGYKYFDLRDVKNIRITYRGTGSGTIQVRTLEDGDPVGSVSVFPSDRWALASAAVKLNGTYPLYLRFCGKGRIDLKTITFSWEDTL